jgi:hypothetical protein
LALSDISLNWGPGDYALIALMIGGPGLGIGCLCGAIAWRAHRVWGGIAGAIAGFGLNLGAFFVWAGSNLSVSLDFHGALLLALAHGLPGLVAGAALGAWLWRSSRISGATCGALAGLVLWSGAWLYLGGS